MKNQWRLLLRHNLFSATPRLCRPVLKHQVSSSSSATFSTASISSFIPHLPTFNHPTFPSHFHRYYSSELPINGDLPDTSLVIRIFSKPIDGDDIQKEIVSNNVVITRDLVYDVLKDLTSEPNTALKLFNWVSEREKDFVGPLSYSLMLQILGSNGYMQEFWGMVDEMRNKGIKVRRRFIDPVLERFEKDGLQDDVDKLMGLFAKDVDVSAAALSSRISRIVRREVWDENVEEELKGLGVAYSTELVNLVFEKLETTPMKALIFFRWVEESGLFRHDKLTYTKMLLVLGREDCMDRFWSVVGDMRVVGYEMDTQIYVMLLRRFIQKRLMADAVSLYEFTMNGVNKPSPQDCIFLLRKLATAKELDMDLFSRVVKAFTRKGYALEDSMLDAVLKALTSVGRMRECNKVLDAMIEVGFVPSGAMQGRIAFDLSSSKLKDEANEFMEKLKDLDISPDCKTWSALIEGHCVAGDLDEASERFKAMIEKEGISYAANPLDLLVNAYCTRQRAFEACKILSDLIEKEKVKPWHTTYKTLISKLIDQKGLQDGLPVLGLMKNHGFPPYLDPFVQYISRKGTPDEAMLIFKAMTVKQSPSTNVFLRVFEAFSKAGRYKQAQSLLAKCPQFIRNNADVLNIFCAMKTEKPPKPAVVAA